MQKELNPKIWEDKKLREDVRETIIDIVSEFMDNLIIPVEILDVRVVGSNASYNYTEHSDLDVHIISNLELVGSPTEIVQALYNSERSNFNRTHNIKIKGIEVELYVEDVNSAVTSNGIYSVIDDVWIKEPQIIKERSVKIDKNELQGLVDSVQSVLDDGDSDDIKYCINMLYLMRKDSIATDGEYGVGNLLFKEIRNRGLLNALKDKYNEMISDELTLEHYFL
nr:MAG TPA: protein of unknown function (DUF4269) [Caudoviricetes sp.]